VTARGYEEVLGETYEVLGRFARGRTLTEQTDLLADLGLDSVQVMELVLEVEDRFDISVPLNVLPSVRTVRDLAREFQRLTSER
jgi:acyl carrier protein